MQILKKISLVCPVLFQPPRQLPEPPRQLPEPPRQLPEPPQGISCISPFLFFSGYFTFALEKSYAGGRTDLEFIGKFHTQFAGLRFLLEFKYYSNARWKKNTGKTGGKISRFQPPEADIKQIKAYEAQWKNE
ncbi:MAG: hypothetical protein GY950_21835, partial [bacterium]|nr:hypothetical protein [bacterium]